MNNRVVYSTVNGQMIPVSESIEKLLNVKPLTYMGNVVKDGRGNIVMNDRWIYVTHPRYGTISINVRRAQYCNKMYLSTQTIQESIGKNKLMDSDLKLFVEKVSDKLVFEKFGRWYQVFLYRKNRRTYGIKKVSLYKWTIDPNRKFDGIFAHELSIDWRSMFYVR